MNAVITGVGAVSAFGLNCGALWDGLARGACAVRAIEHFDASLLPVRVAGEVPVAAPTPHWLREQLPNQADNVIERLSTRRAFGDRKVSFALLAAHEAWQQAGCGAGDRDAWLIMGLGLEFAQLGDFSRILHEGQLDWTRDDGGYNEVRYRSPVDETSRAVRALLQLRGPVVNNVSACAAGTLAVMHAAALIERGQIDVAVCGASDSMINPLGVGGMARLAAPSPRASSDACRPFDRDRDGLAMGEGAAMFVVESQARARARGARILAHIVGHGSTQDAYRATAPRPDGSAAARAMTHALAHAGLAPSSVEYINAHGTGTPLGDPAEANALQQAFGSALDKIPVSSIKGAIGHLMAAAGAVELAASLLCFSRNLLPGTTNLRALDPECPINAIGEVPLERNIEYFMSNSFGFGGQNASLIVQRGDA